MPAFDYRLVTITPNDAREMLRRNTMNRPLSQSRVNRYAEDMRAGRWHNNGEDILLAEDGTILTGQHRLHAVILAGRAIVFGIKRGIPKDAFVSIDNGAAKTAADILAITGVPGSTNVAASAKLALQFERGEHLRRACGRQTVTEYALANPYLQEACRLARLSAETGLTTSPFAAVLFLANRTARYELRIAEFAHQVAYGEHLSVGDPALTLRNWVVAERIRLRATLPAWTAFAACARAWTAFAKHQRIRQIRITQHPHRDVTEIVGFDYERPKLVPTSDNAAYVLEGSEAAQ